MALCCLFSWPAQRHVHRESLLVLDTEVLGCIGGRKVEGGGFCVICWEWGQKGKGDHNRFPAIELGMRWGIGSQEQ